LINFILINFRGGGYYFCANNNAYMTDLFTRKSRVKKLEEKYRALMRKSFRTALKDTGESEKIQQQASKVFEEIKYLKLQKADK
jgi:hypothetical protein